MASLEPLNWTIGQKEILFKSEIYNLLIYITRLETKKYSKYSSAVNFFDIELKPIITTKEIDFKSLFSLDNVDLMSLVVKSFYDKILSLYSDKRNLIGQIDLSMDTLNNKYIRSSWFKLYDPRSGDEITNLLTAQLLSALRSDTTLQMNSTFNLQFTISNLNLGVSLPSGRTPGTYLSTISVSNKLIQSDFLAPRIFFALLKQGIIDLSIIDTKINCLLISCTFSHFVYTKNMCIYNCLKIFKDRGFDTCINYFVKKYNIFPLIYLQNIGFFKTINHLSRRLERRIIILTKKSTKTKLLSVCFRSDNCSYNMLNSVLPIYLLITKNDSDAYHISFAHKFKISNNGVFCKFCVKNYSKNYHKCLFPICHLCQLHIYKADSQTYMSSYKFCNKSVDYDMSKSCIKCKNIFTNLDCFKRHLLNGKNKRMCLDFHKCNVCKKYAKHDKVTSEFKSHICGTIFCPKCLENHDLNSICFVTNKDISITKKQKIVYFLSINKTSDNYPIFAYTHKINIETLPSGQTNNYSIINNNISNATVIISKHYTGPLIKDYKYLYDKIINYSNINGENNINIFTETLSTLIFNYFKNFVTKKTIYIILCDAKTICILLDYVCKQNYTLIFGKLNSVIGFKTGSLVFKSISNFVDQDIIKTLVLFKTNSVFYSQIPKKINLINVLNNELLNISKDDFTIGEICGNSYTLYETISKDLSSIKDSNVHSFNLLCEITFKMFEANMNCLYQLAFMFKLIKNSLNIKNDGLIYWHKSLSQASNYLFRSQLSYNLPLLDSNEKCVLKNSSKLEIICCEILTDLHKYTCPNTSLYYSLINNNGQQFVDQKNKHLTIDFLCASCQNGYAIEGLFKIVRCKFHKLVNNSTFFGQTKSHLSKIALKNRTNFLTSNPNIKLTVFNSCCLKDIHNLKFLKNYFKLHLIRYNILKIKPKVNYLIQKYKDYYLNFDKQKFTRLAPQDVINTSLLESITPFCDLNMSKNPSTDMIFKIDLNSAYASSLNDMKLPHKTRGTTLVHNDAQSFYNELKHSKNIPVAYGRAFIVPPRYCKIANIIPFFSFKNGKDFSNNFILCRTCFLEHNISTCTHNDKLRGWYHTADISSFVFSDLTLGYCLNFTEITYFTQYRLYTELTNVSNIIINLKNNNGYFKMFSKSILLTGLGSFALNASKYSKITPIHNEIQLINSFSKNKNKNIDHYYFFGKNTDPFCFVEQKTNRSDHIRKPNNKICFLVFALASNHAKIKIYKDCMNLLIQKCLLLRIDVDSILFAINHVNQKNMVNKLLRGKSYKLESDQIIKAVSFKKRFYINIYTNNKYEFKCSGLSLPINEKFTLNLTQLICSFLEQNNFDHIFKSRIVDKSITRNCNISVLNSKPYGLQTDYR